MLISRLCRSHKSNWQQVYSNPQKTNCHLIFNNNSIKYVLNSCCHCCCSFNFEFDFLQREGIYNGMFLEFSRLLFHFGFQRSLVYKKCSTEKKAVIKKLQRLHIIKNLLYSTNRRNRISLKNYSSEFLKNIELLEHASSRTEICPGW